MELKVEGGGEWTVNKIRLDETENEDKMKASVIYYADLKYITRLVRIWMEVFCLISPEIISVYIYIYQHKKVEISTLSTEDTILLTNLGQ